MGNCLSDSKPQPPIPTDFTTLTPQHFSILNQIGSGAFGFVYRVSRLDNNKHYAMKFISKKQLVRKRKIDHILQERDLLVRLRSPWLCNLCYSFSDGVKLVMVLELKEGGDLSHYILKAVELGEAVLIGWMVGIVLGLQYLHGMGVLHRDIKPENILLDRNGFVCLTDLNVACWRGEGVRGRVGTRGYMAPEVVGKKRYAEEADWWSCGVVFYEILVGRKPFNDEEGYRILFPKRGIKKEAQELVSGILTVDRHLRFRQGDIIAHPYFYGIDWNQWKNREIVPTFTPDPKFMECVKIIELQQLLGGDEDPMEKTSKFLKSKKYKEYRLKYEKEYGYLEERWKYFDWEKEGEAKELKEIFENRFYSETEVSLSGEGKDGKGSEEIGQMEVVKEEEGKKDKGEKEEEGKV